MDAEQPALKVTVPPSLQDMARNDAIRYGTDMVRMIETILEDRLSTEMIKKCGVGELWMPSQKSLKLTFLNETDAQILGIQFEEAKLLYLCSQRRTGVGISKILALNQLGQLNRVNIKRSVGSEMENMNERKLQASSITYNTGTFKDGNRGGGISGRIAGLFGRGGR